MPRQTSAQIAAQAEMERRKREGILEAPEPLWRPNVGKNGNKNPQQLALESEADELFFGGAPGGGKGLALDTSIPTIYGFKNMGALRVGDWVFDKDGKPCMVSAVSETHYRPCFEFVFDDGSSLIADDQHRWLTKTRAERQSNLRRTEAYRASRRDTRVSRAIKNPKRPDLQEKITQLNSQRPHTYLSQTEGSVRNTLEILETLYVDADRRLNHSIDVAGALQLEEQALPIDPYTLGLWLGDGISSNGTLGMLNEDLDQVIPLTPYAELGRSQSKRDKKPFSLVKLEGLRKLLHENKLLGNKHIPALYLRSSIAQRQALLRGLLDTDGTCDTRGQIELGFSNERLAREAQMLILSLGIKCTLRIKALSQKNPKHKDHYRIKFMAHFPAFSLKRKLDRQKITNFRQTVGARFIKAIKPVESVPTRCISVDSPSRTYLAGENFIPTHNSDLILGLATTQHRNAVIFRKELQQMKGAEGIIARSKEIIGKKGRFNGQDNVWRNIEGFRTLEFAGLNDEKSRTKQQGRARDFFGFDEIPEMSEAAYTFVIAWNRTKHPDQRCRVVCVGNPPTTPEGQWVTRRWAAWLDRKHPKPAKEGELRWYAMVNGKDTEVPDNRTFVMDGTEIKYDYDPAQYSPIEIIVPKSRTFISSSVTDNPYLMATGYIATIQRLPEPLRTIMLNPAVGFNMTIQDDLWQVIPTVWVMNAIERGKITPKPQDVVLSAMGVDPSRGGQDDFVIAKRYNDWFSPLIRHPGYEAPNGQSGAALIMREIDENSDPIINIDVIGVGSSPHDFLVDAEVVSEVNDINFAEASSDYDDSGKFKMANVRAAAYWKMRETLNPEKNTTICLPDDDIMKADLCAARYKLTTRGIQIETKDDIRERIGRSPDSGDAVVLCNFSDVGEALPMYYGAI